MKKSTENKGEYYAEYDEDESMWLVFHTENNKAYSSWCDQDKAEQDADERNGMVK